MKMSKATRRSLLKGSLEPSRRPAPAGGPDAATAGSAALDRRSFLMASAGAAAGVAVVVGGPRLATAALHGADNTVPLGAAVKPSGPPPAETVMAYIRDAEKGEVTVLSGTSETTYRDPALTRRMLDAAR
jgi:hypothetical protein